MMLNKRFLLGLVAIASLTAYACDDDDDSSSCSNGATKACANATTAVMCLNGDWKEVKCTGTQVCNAVSQKCTEPGSNGGNTGGNGGNTGGNNNNTLPACSMSEAGQSCSACKPVCSPDGSSAYLCNSSKGTSMKWTCANNDCAVDDTGNVTCSKPEGGNNNNTLPACSMSEAGQSCSSCTPVCSADGSTAYLCNSSKGTSMKWTCANNDCAVDDKGSVTCSKAEGGNGGNGGNTTLPACSMSEAGQSCSSCTPVCSADGSTAYLCNSSKGTSMKWTCANNDCAVDAKGSVTCSKAEGGNGGTVTVDPSIPKDGDACTYKSSEAKCASNGSYGVICGSENTYYNYTCKNNDCVVCDGFLKCGTCSSATTEKCTANSTSKCSAACSADGKTGYYWTSATNSIETVDCSEKSNCTLDGNYVQCGETVACDESNHGKGTCAADGATAEVCYGGKMVTWECFNNACSVAADGVVTCPRDTSSFDQNCNGDKVNRLTSGGTTGDCCDPTYYEPAGCVSNAGLRCDSKGVVKAWTCKSPQTCNYDSATKYYSCK